MHFKRFYEKYIFSSPESTLPFENLWAYYIQYFDDYPIFPRRHLTNYFKDNYNLKVVRTQDRKYAFKGVDIRTIRYSLSVKETAAILGKSENHVRYLCKSNKIKSKHYMIDAVSVSNHMGREAHNIQLQIALLQYKPNNKIVQAAKKDLTCTTYYANAVSTFSPAKLIRSHLSTKGKVGETQRAPTLQH